VKEHFDLGGALRRIRRRADLSQREMARRLELSKSSAAAAESGAGGMDARVLAQAAAIAGLRLALVDGAGAEVPAMGADTVRDLSGRHFPAHLDTRRSDEGCWLYEPRRDRPESSFTYTKDRDARDRRRRAGGTPEDHLPLVPGDSPAERAAARRREYWRHRAEERERRFLAGEFAGIDDGFDCTCLPRCEELDDFSGRPVHAPDCPCRCDVG
jgi:HTH-type transcriptional regulator/antitoxin HipB